MATNWPAGSARVNWRTMLSGTAALLAAPYIISSARAAAPAINVGVIVPLSGANAQFGINSRNGIELVADEINAAGGITELGGAKDQPDRGGRHLDADHRGQRRPTADHPAGHDRRCWGLSLRR